MPRASIRAVQAWLALGTLTLACLAVGFVRDFSLDFHWHVVLGEEILGRREILSTDTLSHTFRGQPMFVSSWLADVLFALAFRAGGLPACYLVRFACVAATTWLLVTEMTRLGLSLGAAAAIALFLLAQVAFHLYLRPEMFALLLFAALLHALGEHQRTLRPRTLGFALAILALWPNVHGSVGIGLAALGFYWAEHAIGRLRSAWSLRQLGALLAFPMLAFLATCASPEGVRAPLAFRILRPTWLAHTTEWLPFDAPQASPLLYVTFTALLVVTVLGRKNLSPWRFLFVLLLTYMAWRFRRFATYGLLAAAPLFAAHAKGIAGRLGLVSTLRPVLAALPFLLGTWDLAWVKRIHRDVGLGPEPGVYPEAACRFVRAERPVGLMFNDYDFGSFLMHCLGRDYPVFIDQRAWSVYSESFYESYFAAGSSPEALRQVADAHDVAWLITGYNPLAQEAAASPSTWRLVYFDDRALIYVRVDRQGNLRLAESHGFRHLDPAGLGDLPAISGPRLAEADAELRRQEASCRSCTRTKLAQAALAIAHGDNVAFTVHIGKLVERDETPEAAFLAGAHAMKQKEYQRAGQFFGRMADLGGDPRVAARLQAWAAQRGRGDGSAREE
ncbi:MAG: hypothetical protein HY698_17705 [Deltaproteobacteria bacterium]|nr:hypothetical protein [Deltaproteobacteria bacterium]